MRDHRRNAKAPLSVAANAANERGRAEDAAEILSETRHKQRKRCAWSPSRRGRCESDRGSKAEREILGSAALSIFAATVGDLINRRYDRSQNSFLARSGVNFCGASHGLIAMIESAFRDD